VVSVTDPYDRILGFLEERLLLYSRLSYMYTDLLNYLAIHKVNNFIVWGITRSTDGY
jgi:hypothetical protein